MSAAENGGLFAAPICPMTEEGALDRASLERHFATVLSDPGQAGLLLNGVRPNAVRFMPPLTVTAEEIDEAIGRLDDALKQI